ncbi:MAG: hypothetical protein M3N43_09520 [Actinomycetota bacterium]|nr:hypothetical protein [Actinomycetota bacterium]
MSPAQLALLFLAFSVGCRSSAGEPDVGQLTAEWAGAATGSVRLTATATWCAGDAILEILAREGDTGVGMAVHYGGSGPITGSFGLIHPAQGVAQRPAATGALRFTTTDALHAYLTRSGEVEITAVDQARVTGRMTFRLASRVGSDTLFLVGSFRDVPVDSARTPCGLAPPTPAEVF